MGVYIPNMEKPKGCKECQWHLDFYIEDEQVGGLCTITEKDDKENICPLIEIDDEEMNGLINLYKICKGASEVKSIQLKDIKPVVF